MWPYNIDVTKAVGRGHTKHRNFVMTAGEMSPAEFTIFLGQTLGLAAKNSADGALCDEAPRAIFGLKRVEILRTWVS